MRRVLSRELHSLLGLLFGLPLVLIGLTGSVLTFREPIDRALNPDLLSPTPSAKPSSARAYAAMLEEAAQFVPRGALPQALELPTDARPVSTLSFKHTADGGEHWYEVTFDPRTRERLGARATWGASEWTRRSLIYQIYDLHVSLLLGPTGQTVVGLCALGLCASLLTGIWLWWPRAGRLRAALTMRRRASSARRNYELHRLLGLYGTLSLAVLGFSGSYFVFPELVTSLLRPLCAPVQPQPPARPTSSPVFSLDQVLPLAKRTHPQMPVKSILLPGGNLGAYVVTWDAGPTQIVRSSFAADNGAELQRRDDRVDARAPGDVILDWQFPLHSGQAFGMWSRVLIALTGVVPLLLWFTGLAVWRKRALGRAALHRGRAARAYEARGSSAF
jgi:uncharacterized iron-regulated membrane protein